jgi:AcrR family transcriptional regulator
VSGVAISTLQTYFGSREDMLVEALIAFTDAETAAMRDQIEQVDDPWERLLLLLDRGLETPVPVWRMLWSSGPPRGSDRLLPGRRPCW